MPGVAQLAATGPSRIRIEYQQLTDGAQIRYSTDDPGLIEAIHRWFDPQLRDHEDHAVPRRGHDAQHAQ